MCLDVILSIFFFFSSRRRHTRFDCDWSSDVCSSDLRGSNFEALAESVAAGRIPNAELAIVVSNRDRKSTRLNSSHSQISYAVFCLKKKKTKIIRKNISLNTITSEYELRHRITLPQPA